MRTINTGSCIIAFFALSQSAFADPAATLYSFPGMPGVGSPNGPIAIDRNGNIFGTGTGGPNDTSVVYELNPPPAGGSSWTITIIHAFRVANDYIYASGVIRDSAGNLFGTTTPDVRGCGNVYELKKTSGGLDFRLLHNFANSGFEGCNPTAITVAGSNTLFGVTERGGSTNQGTVFQLSPPVRRQPGLDL